MVCHFSRLRLGQGGREGERLEETETLKRHSYCCCYCHRLSKLSFPRLENPFQVSPRVVKRVEQPRSNPANSEYWTISIFRAPVWHGKFLHWKLALDADSACQLAAYSIKRWLFLLKILLRQPNSGPDRTLLGINEIGLGPVEVRIQVWINLFRQIK